MAFNSLTFAVFFGLVLALHRLPLSWRTRKANLLGASYLFYGAWNPAFVLLLATSTVVDWWLARWMATARSGARRLLMVGSLVCNLGMLSFFKYGDFLAENFARLLSLAGVAYEPRELGIILPVGISFYTFQSLSYTIDVYRGNMKPWGSFLDFALFVSFFPQLVAGPIVRASDFLPQCSAPRKLDGDQLGWGMALLTIGLFQKVVLADAIMAPTAQQVFGNPEHAGTSAAWLGAFAFSNQIFFDFAGYSTCAIGVARCLGFQLPVNFHCPYAAIGFSDFWRRWHISLSVWLRDYLYIPLGGNRRGPARTYINLALTMLLGGLWHGAAWRFVAWGALHGSYLIVERLLAGWPLPSSWIWRVVGALLTHLLVLLTWVFFRAESFDDAWVLLSAMFMEVDGFIPLRALAPAQVLVVGTGLLAVHWTLRARTIDSVWASMRWWTRALVLAAMWVAIVLQGTAGGVDHEFIYFQF